MLTLKGFISEATMDKAQLLKRDNINVLITAIENGTTRTKLKEFEQTLLQRVTMMRKGLGSSMCESKLKSSQTRTYI